MLPCPSSRTRWTRSPRYTPTWTVARLTAGCAPGRWPCRGWSAWSAPWGNPGSGAFDNATRRGSRRRRDKSNKDDHEPGGSGSGRYAYEGMDRVLNENARLDILTSLMTHPKGLPFGELKALCSLTVGNL